MSKKINLTIGERIAALRIFDAFKGSITELATIMDDIKVITVTQEEWDKAERVVTKVENSEQWKWNEGDEKTWKEVELGTETISYLVKSIKEKSDKGEITLADAALISLNKKL